MIRRGWRYAGLLLFGLNMLPVTAALAIPLTLTPGPVVGNSATYSADLGLLDLLQLESITVTDDGSAAAGAPGIFSGFDLDALFLDQDGDLGTDNDRFFATLFEFSAGSTRPVDDPRLQPSTTRPGPTFGAVDASTVDLALASLDTLDGNLLVDVELASGYLSLGDGGSLTARFEPPVALGATLFLVVGEVGGQGEGLAASVAVNNPPGQPPTPIPAPATAGLLGLGLALLLCYRYQLLRSSRSFKNTVLASG